MMRRAVTALCALAACSGCAFALNPDLEVSQYAHTSWKVRDGFPKGGVNSIAQTPDGYLWLGTEFGLFRFDGVTSTAFQPPPGQRLPSDNIRRVFVSRDGTLWIGTLNGLASWKNGRLTQYAELAGARVGSFLEDREGTIWVGWVTRPGKLCAIQNGNVHCFGEDGRLNSGVFGLYEAKDGALWMGVVNGIWRWKPGPPKFYQLPGNPNGIQGFDQERDGKLLITTATGVLRFNDGKTESYPLMGIEDKVRSRTLLRDREGSRWIGTNTRGLMHLHEGRADVFGESEGLSADDVASAFEDREGDVWVGTYKGLDRFRDYAVASFSGNLGLSNPTVTAVLPDREGSVWATTYDGLRRVAGGQISEFRSKRSLMQGRTALKSGVTGPRVREIAGTGLPDNTIESLFQDAGGRIWIATGPGVGYMENDRFRFVKGLPGGIIHAFADDSEGSLWVANQNEGLFLLPAGKEPERIPWSNLRAKGSASALAADPKQRGLWIGFFEEGIALYRDGQIRESYGIVDGLGRGQVNDLRFEGDGTLWAATEGGLSRLKNGHIITLNSANGLPCDGVHWSLEDDARSFWLYMPCGLVRIPGSQLDAWAAAVDRAPTAKRSVQFTIFDSSDGVRTIGAAGGYTPHAGKSPDGKLWFTSVDVLNMIDPRHLPFNKLPPPVRVEQLIADRKSYDAAEAGRHLPALIRDLEIDYTALSLVAPEKNRFRYQLEGYDSGWVDAGTRRQAFYTNLAPRRYRFRVLAANNSGVWNETGASLDFFIDPAYYQTNWFRALMAALVLAAAWGLYRLRLYQVERQFGAILAERSRIARELHDTLLQSFQGSLLQFQAARNLLARRPEDAARTLDEAIGNSQAAISEGRDAIQNLRSGAGGADLARLLTALGKELSGTEQNGAVFGLTVEGQPKTLAPLLQDEVYRIGRELVLNAFKHAHARRIEIDVRYDERMLRLRVRDDGVGIDPKMFGEGARPGHWGLPGVRERAKLVGAKLDFWSEAGAGTEVQLAVPAVIAYARPKNERPNAG